MKKIAPGEMEAAVETFLREDIKTLLPSRRRERSWDFCWSHFQDSLKPTQTMDLSCLHLGYYLASWGMLRGSSFLFRDTNARHYREAVEVIERHNPMMRTIDVHRYREPGVVEAINAAWADLHGALLPEGGRGLTLVSKVMMGTWGCVPSYDSFFIRTFRGLAETRAERGSFGRAGESSFLMLADIYDEHVEEIERLRQRFKVWDMATGTASDRRMPRAKVIDIYGFQTTFGG